MAARGAKKSSRGAAEKRKQLGDIKRLVDAIFAVADPVEVGSRLLAGKGDATVAKTFALLLEYLFGKPVQQIEASGPEGAQITYQFISSAPRPHRGAGGDTEEE
jgi:hypothetical protein